MRQRERKIYRIIQHPALRLVGGFTLIEILVFSAIFGIVIIGFLSILVTVTQIESRQGAEAVVNQESQFLLSTIQRSVENSSLVDIPENVATSTLVLRTSASSTDPTYIYLSGTTVYLKQSTSGVAQALTSPSVKITSMSFTRKLNPPGHDSVATNFTIAYYVSMMPQNVSRSLQLSVSRVSAATFDSNLIPSSTATYNLGVAGSVWNSVNSTLYFSGSNVGVGVSSPGQALEVNGGVRLHPTSVSQPTCDAVNGRDTMWVTETSTAGVADLFQICSRQGDGTYTWKSPNSNPAGSNGQVQFNSSGVFGADSNFFWDNTNKRLGIGTTTPGFMLDVANPIVGADTINWRNSTGLSLGRLGVTGAGNDAGWVALFNAGVNSIYLRGTGVSYFNGGNVGIGTTFPSSTLHVVGSAIVTSQVGIATTTPTQPLTVQGNINATGNIAGRSGIILQSPNGTCYNLTITNNGMFSTSSITCI